MTTLVVMEMDTVMYFGKPVVFPAGMDPAKREKLIRLMREREQTGKREFFYARDRYCDECDRLIDKANYYMVTNAIWRDHGVGNGMLCLPCLEQRMGRSLVIDDFSDCPLNQKFLINRLDLVFGK